MLLKNKVCLVTGCSSGIGKSIAEKFATEGAVVYANSLSSENIDCWADELKNQTSSEIIPVYFDVRDSAAVKDTVMLIKRNHQHIDVLVNNAGLVSYEMIPMIDMAKMREMYEVNVFAVVQLLQLVSRVMTKQGGGSIINMASIVGSKGVKGQLAYAGTKGAVIAITKSAAKELAQNNIRVNAIAPGMVATDRLVKAMEQGFSAMTENIGFKRMAKPEEIADLAVFLASDRSAYISGQIIGADGVMLI